MYAGRVSRVRATLLALSVSGAIALSACVSSEESTPASMSHLQSDSVVGSSAAESSPSALETKQPNDPADPSTWVIEEGGVGPVRLGESFIDTLNALPGAWVNSAECSWLATWVSPDGSYSLSFKRRDGTMIGDVSTIAVRRLSGSAATGPTTPDGLQLGSQVSASESYIEIAADEALDEALWFEVVDSNDADDANSALFVRSDDGVVRVVALTDGTVPAGASCN